MLFTSGRRGHTLESWQQGKIILNIKMCSIATLLKRLFIQSLYQAKWNQHFVEKHTHPTSSRHCYSLWVGTFLTQKKSLNLCVENIYPGTTTSKVHFCKFILQRERQKHQCCSTCNVQIYSIVSCWHRRITGLEVSQQRSNLCI